MPRASAACLQWSSPHPCASSAEVPRGRQPASAGYGAVIPYSDGDTPRVESEDEAPAFEGTYSNDTYGYSVRIPAGMVGLGATPPAPQHGFGIDLDNPSSTRWPYGV